MAEVTYIKTDYMYELVETDNISKVPFEKGRLIIVDNGEVYYDKTIGTNATDGRVRLQNVSKHFIANDDSTSDADYCNEISNPSENDTVIIERIIGTYDSENLENNSYKTSVYFYTHTGTQDEVNTYDWVKIEQAEAELLEEVTVTSNIGALQQGTVLDKGTKISDVVTSMVSGTIEPEILPPIVNLVNYNFEKYNDIDTFTPSMTFEIVPPHFEYGPETIDYTVEVSSIKCDTTNTGYAELDISNATIAITKDDLTNYSYVTLTMNDSNGTQLPTNLFYEVIFNFNCNTVPLAYPSGIAEYAEQHQLIGYAKGYRYIEGCYYGTLTNVSEDDDLAVLIQENCNRLNDNFKNTTFNLNVKAGTQSVIIAIPMNLWGDNYQSNNDFYTDIYKVKNLANGLDITDCFKALGDGIDAKAAIYIGNHQYWVYCYTPVKPFVIDTELEISIGYSCHSVDNFEDGDIKFTTCQYGADEYYDLYFDFNKYTKLDSINYIDVNNKNLVYISKVKLNSKNILELFDLAVPKEDLSFTVYGNNGVIALITYTSETFKIETRV